MITLLNVVFLVWAVAMLPVAHYFWQNGVRVPSLVILSGAAMIVVGQALDIYSRTLVSG